MRLCYQPPSASLTEVAPSLGRQWQTIQSFLIHITAIQVAASLMVLIPFESWPSRLEKSIILASTKLRHSLPSFFRCSSALHSTPPSLWFPLRKFRSPYFIRIQLLCEICLKACLFKIRSWADSLFSSRFENQSLTSLCCGYIKKQHCLKFWCVCV